MKLHSRTFFLKAIYISGILFLLGACAPKIAPSVPEPPVAENTSEVEQPPLTPCVTFDSLSGEDQETAMTAYVLYKDKMKVNQFEEALPLWKQAYYLAPGSNGRVKSQFEDGIAIYKHLFNNTTDDNLKRRLVDTIYNIYDKRSYCFGEEAYIAGRKAFDGYYYFQSYVDTNTIFRWFLQNIDEKGVETDYFVVNPFSKMLFDKVVNGALDPTQGLHYAKLMQKIVDHGVSTCKGKDCETWNIIAGYAPALLEQLEGVEDFYDCDYYVEKYRPMVTMYPDSCDLVKTALARLNRGNCPETLAALQEIQEIKNRKCKEEAPTPGLAKQGYDAYQKGRYKEAILKFEAFAEESKDSETKAKYYLLISKIYYGDLKNFPKSRQYARLAAGLKPGWGEPYMLIGKLYASSGPLCGSGTGWDSQVVTWVAIDQFQLAKSIDPSMTQEANQWINRYSQYMPKKEDIFSRLIKKGDTYFVPCWIQEETRVRTAD